MPKCEPIKIYASTVRKNIVNKYVTIMLLQKESMILLRREKCNFIEQNC